MKMKLLQLFITASIPVKHLNSVAFYVFTPALVGSILAQTITYHSMVKLWFMPVNILLTFIVGSIFGWILLLLPDLLHISEVSLWASVLLLEIWVTCSSYNPSSL
ncbi:hypothetical protein M0R45_025642 [Rubus argutus]|uniref:Uncharacterized protein n=1 Tax=Rubus argutus TaxID=59490 RepID=A0AAW1WUR1_RUBAR